MRDVGSAGRTQPLAGTPCSRQKERNCQIKSCASQTKFPDLDDQLIDVVALADL
jgi:hypothetical protein